MLINKNYCDENTCVALRELGYNYPQRLIPDYFGIFEEPQYDEKIHLYDAQKWLREEKGVIVGIINNFTTQEFDYYVSTWAEDRCRGNEYTTYENALLRGIKEAVKILKEEEK